MGAVLLTAPVNRNPRALHTKQTLERPKCVLCCFFGFYNYKLLWCLVLCICIPDGVAGLGILNTEGGSADDVGVNEG